jgi:hypothetical protein
MLHPFGLIVWFHLTDTPDTCSASVGLLCERFEFKYFGGSLPPAEMKYYQHLL